MKSRVLTIASIAVLAVVLVTSVSAASLTLGDLTQVSGMSPLTGCTADGAATQTGVNYTDSEVEPWIDVDPTDADDIVGIWQQDRWSNGGARGLVVGRSTDRGVTWAFGGSLKTSLCTGGTSANGGGYQRATDPWVTYGPAPTGILYQLSLSFNDVAPPFNTFDFDHALLASRSTDDGATWSDPVVVIRDTAPTVFNDKQSITADPTNANYVYAIWDRLKFPASERASVAASFNTSAFSGPTWFARSIDAGQSWEAAKPIWDPGQNDQTIANQIVVQPNGDLVNIFTEFNNENAKKRRGAFVRVLRSSDKGATWTGPFDVARLGAIGASDPETGDPVRDGAIIPDIAVDASSGRLYAVWQDARFNGGQADSIAFSQSSDGGRTWSDPIKVNKTPASSTIGNEQAFTASVDVAGDGTVAVTYYDLRNNTSAAPLLTDYFIVHCHTSCTNAGNWTEDPEPLTGVDASFDMRQAPLAGGFFTGDYAGLANAGDTFTAFWSMPHEDTDPTDPSSTFFRKAG